MPTDDEIKRAIQVDRLFRIYLSLAVVGKQICDYVVENGKALEGDTELLKHLAAMQDGITTLIAAHDQFCKGRFGVSVADNVERQIDEELGR